MKEVNTLYPIFLKLRQLHVLIIGGGFVGFEKLQYMLKSSPDARITLVAKEIRPEVRELGEGHQVEFIDDAYNAAYLAGKQLVIAATNFPEVNKQIYDEAKLANVLVNVADTPHLCDFYLGSVITKGHLKMAISTNGKSPTTAKRLRQYFEEILPDDLSEMLEYVHAYRETLKGDFEAKVEAMNELTSGLLIQSKHVDSENDKSHSVLIEQPSVENQKK